MGGQQFGTGNLHLDLCDMNGLLSFDPERGLVDVEAGMQWPQLIGTLTKMQEDRLRALGIRQKQTGADRLCIGGALASNVHGRGLRMRPFVEDVEAFKLMTANGDLVECTRLVNPELFRLVIGGYGMFGIVYSVRLRLMPRQRLRRVVKMTTTEALAGDFQSRIKNGFMFGDFQFAIDPQSQDFLRNGVSACYEPVEIGGCDESQHRRLSERDWRTLLHLAHVKPTEAFERYAQFYLSTDGQTYWSDTHQLGYYCDDYHREIDHVCRCSEPGSEMITELYLPRLALEGFMQAARSALRRNGTRVIYGTVRLIEEDLETYLPWARGKFACVVLNLHCQHDPRSLAQAENAFRVLIDLALSCGGNFYLTYHNYASRSNF